MKTPEEFVSALFEIEVMTHIAHLQTTSFSQHMALNELYQSMPEFRDEFAEAFQGYKGIIRGYKDITVKEGINMVDYLTKKTLDFSAFRETLTDSSLQQIVDDINQQLYSSLYKLKILK